MEDNESSIRNRLLNFIERDRFSFTTAIVYIFILGAVRSIMEAYIGAYQRYSIYLFSQHVLLSYPEILIGVLLVYVVTRIEIKKIWNVFIFGFWMLLLPPIIDYVIFGDFGSGLGVQYEYQEVSNLIPILKNLWNPMATIEAGSKGQGAMFLALLFGSTIYVALKLDLIGKFKSMISEKKVYDFSVSLSKTVATYFSIALLFWFIGGFTFFINLQSRNLVLFNYFKINFNTQYYMFFQNHGYTMDQIIAPTGSGDVGLAQNLIIQQRHLLMCCFFILLTVFSALSLLYYSAKEKLYSMLKNIPWLYSLLFLSSSLLGIMSVHVLDPDFSKGWAIDPTYFLHIPYVFMCFTTIFLLGIFSRLIQDISDHKTDRSREDPLKKGIMKRYHYVHLCASIGLTALFFSLILGMVTFFLTIIWILFSWFAAYKHWTFLKRVRLAILGAFSFVFGFYTPGSWISRYINYSGDNSYTVTRVNIHRIPSISPEIIFIIIWVFLGIWFISLVKNTINEKRSDPYKFSLSENTIEFIIISISIAFLLFPLIFFHQWFSVLIFLSIAFVTPLWYRLLKRTGVFYFFFAMNMIFFALHIMY